MTKSDSFDLVVYGGTPGGIACALRCAREGLSVALVNVTQHLGGMLSAGLGLFDALYTGSRSPLNDEIFGEMARHYDETYGPDSEQARLCRTHQAVEPHVAERVFDRLVQAERGITVLRGWCVAHASVAERRITRITLRTMAGDGRRVLVGRAFVDASYEGDLMAAAGAPYRVGRESRAEFGEPHAGKIFTRYEEGKDGPQYPYEAAHGLINLKPFDLCTGRIFPGSTGEGDRAVQAYNFRIILARDPQNQVPVPKPANYRRENYLGLLQTEQESLGIPYPVKSKWLIDDIRDFKFRNHRTMPNRKVSWNHGNFTGRNHAYPEADWTKRREILQAHRDHELGLLWFLQNDPEVPAEVRARANELGLARDEFTDNENFPWEIYVREARRLRGRAIFTELDGSLAPGLRRTPPHADSIAITDWMMDSHECNTERQPGSAYEGALLLSELSRPAHVPFRCLLPPNLDNLLVPVCLSATHVGWGALRLEPTWMHVAESAAWAIVMSAARGIAPAAVDPAELQRTLVARGVMISFFNDFDMTTPETWVPAVQYFGCRGFFCSYDARPRDPLDARVAGLWCEALHREAAGTHQPLELAQALVPLEHRPPPRPTEGITRDQFSALLSPADAPASHARAAGNGSPLSRGEACELMFRQLEAGSAMPADPVSAAK